MSHGQRIGPGRVVHYVMGNGEVRPAQIIKIWGPDPTGEDIHYTAGNPHGMYSCLQLMVTLDGQNDLHYSLEQVQESVNYMLERQLEQGVTKREAIEYVIKAHGHIGPLFRLVHSKHTHDYSSYTPKPDDDPSKDQLYVYQVVTVNGFFGWATSVNYDPYDWRPQSWHWPQDKKLVKPEHMEPAAKI